MLPSILALLLAATPDAPAAKPVPPLSLRGTWILDAGGRAIAPSGFRRGLQPSGLLFRRGELWSIGDQRSEYPGHVFRLDPATGRLLGKPIPLEIAAEPGKDPELDEYRKIPNSDFEALAVDPKDPDRLLAVTEDKIPWIVEIRLEGAGTPATDGARARILHLTRFRVPDGVAPWRDDPNYAAEGIAIADDGKTVYLAYERAQDELPRIYELSLDSACSGTSAHLEDTRVRFDTVPRRASKERARLNLNDIQFLRVEGRPALLGVLRDQERLLLIDLEKKECSRVLDLDLTDPAGGPIEWVSPEGIAVDAAADRLWIINDPDSVDKNYRARGEPAATGRFAEYAPLLFEMKLSTVVGSGAAK